MLSASEDSYSLPLAVHTSPGFIRRPKKCVFPILWEKAFACGAFQTALLSGPMEARSHQKSVIARV